MRAANRFESGFGVDGFLGLGLSDLDIRVKTPVQSDSDSHASYGPLIGATLSCWIVAPLRIYAEGSAHLGFGSNYSTATVTSLDLGAALRLGHNAEFTAGWRRLHYEAEFEDGTRSDLDLELSGPLIALWLNF